ncbi:RNA polymerase sigma factor (sigma-70 family) [Pedobacter africanus]|uniref:RNA polymerase sigma-70 factor (ECF subfamily) n=1 Tax=Pedobacter africanus TaxID=151894 RepID=A0ACC6KZ73_9SPHI|nr:sigma-70 family RNA polymerase sigma factor [Pedobacter africanus]MDR6784526.1 RNA polymerase sigma-70 factor (ECF subfamily) [Pedobacter africanus]
MKELSDRDLIALLHLNDHEAFAELTRRYWQDLFKHVCSKIRNTEEAQDIIQEIFLSVWKNRSDIRCDDQGRLSSYLYRSAKYASINYFSRSGIALRGVEVLEEMLAYPAAVKSDEGLLMKELHRVVDAELSGLPDRLQLPYRLSREQHLSIREIALRLSVSEQTVKNNITDVLNRIRFRLGKYNSDPNIIFIIASLTVLSNYDLMF